jgi:hypothetical protein
LGDHAQTAVVAAPESIPRQLNMRDNLAYA